MENKNMKSVSLLLILIEFAFVVVVGFRQFIFPADSFLYNLYSEELATLITARLLKTFITVIVCLLIVHVARYVVNLDTKFKNPTVRTAILLIGSILKYVSAVAMILSSLKIWGVDTTAIITGASVLTLVIGLGCQTLVSDIVAGIFMLFEGDIKVGDIVVVNGWRGTVQQIGLRRTRIIDSVDNVNIINNSSISNIINNTREYSYAIIEVGIEYNESIERVEALLKDHIPIMKKEIPAIVDGPFYKGVSELGDSCVKLKLLARCQENDKFQVERDMNRSIKLLFDRNNVNIPFNQIVINYREEDKKTDVDAETIKAAKEFVKYQNKISRGIDDQNS